MSINKAFAAPNGTSGNFWVTHDMSVAPDFSGVRATITLFRNEFSTVTGVGLYSEDVVLTNSDNPVYGKKLINLIEQKLITFAGNSVSGGTVQ
jgi:hypothetical protein